MFKNKTIGKMARRHALAATAAVAVSLGFASQAFASNPLFPNEANPTTSLIQLKDATMVQTYTAHVGTNTGIVDAYSNGVTFDYLNLNPVTKAPVSPTVYTIFGFCVDVDHDMYINTTLNYVYTDNYTPGTGPVGDPLPTDFDVPTPHAIDAPTLAKLTALIDTGWLLHESETAANKGNIDLQLAAIQAAIWHTEGAYVSIDNAGAKAGANAGTAISDPTNAILSYGDYYNAYSTGAFHDLGDANDSFYTIVEASPNYDKHQSFAIGWPIPGVPEPTTWAMMLIGFGGMGAMLRQRKARAAAATA